MNFQNDININYYLARVNEIIIKSENNMLVEKTTNNLTVDFISCLVSYNHMIIEFCKNYLSYDYKSEIANISNDIIKTSEDEIKYLKNVYNNAFNYVNKDREVNSYFKKYFKCIRSIFSNIRNVNVTNNLVYIYISELKEIFNGKINLIYTISKYKIDLNLFNLNNYIFMNCNNALSVLNHL